jgi:membrane protein YdbS with pleckstrin-like domain
MSTLFTIDCFQGYGEEQMYPDQTEPSMSQYKVFYSEKLTSVKTEALFIVLMLLPFSLLSWALASSGNRILIIICAFFFLVFLFYSVNYRILKIKLTQDKLMLKFGLFRWIVPIANIENCCLDNIPMLKRLGGAGIHFIVVNDRYRASFNFLEYPRVVIALKNKVGPVSDISFSTQHPEDLIQLIKGSLVQIESGSEM